MNKENKSTELNDTDKKLHISDVSKSFLFCLEKAMGYAYASATEGVTRKEAQEDFRKYREEMLVEFKKRNVC
jgi:hypothetical protein